MFKEPNIRYLYQFPNVPSHSWKVDDDGSSILSGFIVQQEMIEILGDYSTGFIARRRNQTMTNVKYECLLG